MKKFRAKNCMGALLSLGLAFSVQAGEGSGPEESTPEKIQNTLDTMTLVPMTTQNCYSARNCKGKVLSHRDAHNCKVKSKGKSWRSSSGRCYNL